ncbi:hypothetical protein [Catenulispora yoronensis]|uniref:hypothetical protein n=1 Tax=Catenulispora yoronensis TaxID=450799 RepID=UPI0031DC2AEE
MGPTKDMVVGAAKDLGSVLVLALALGNDWVVIAGKNLVVGLGAAKDPVLVNDLIPSLGPASLVMVVGPAKDLGLVVALALGPGKGLVMVVVVAAGRDLIVVMAVVVVVVVCPAKSWPLAVGPLWGSGSDPVGGWQDSASGLTFSPGRGVDISSGSSVGIAPAIDIDIDIDIELSEGIRVLPPRRHRGAGACCHQ